MSSKTTPTSRWRLRPQLVKLKFRPLHFTGTEYVYIVVVFHFAGNVIKTTKHDNIIPPNHHTVPTTLRWTPFAVNHFPLIRSAMKTPKVFVVIELVTRGELSGQNVHILPIHNCLVATAGGWAERADNRTPWLWHGVEQIQVFVHMSYFPIKVFPPEHGNFVGGQSN